MKKNLAELVFILDPSGSMRGLERDAIEEDFRKRQKKERQ